VRGSGDRCFGARDYAKLFTKNGKSSETRIREWKRILTVDVSVVAVLLPMGEKVCLLL
jgi:hypothetical protein